MQITELRRSFVYHSPQYPGFTSWCGLWAMPDDTLMCSLTQATGPFAGRPQAPDHVRACLDWPPVITDSSGQAQVDETYDMTGLDLANLHLLSTDFGETWSLTGRDHFRSCMNGTTGESEEVLADGTLLRAVWGPYLPYDDVPRTGYMERSADRGNTWSGPEVIYDEPGYMFWPKRVRRLRDGRVLAGGGLIRTDPAHDHRHGWFRDATVALFVADAEGRAWQGPIDAAPREERGDLSLTEEFDWAELEDGDLLLVIRAAAGAQRLQTRLHKAGDGWRPGPVAESALPHSGHPEVLRTDDGHILHVATTGLSCTVDEGQSWQDLSFDDGLDGVRGESGSPYYPRSVQMANGEILVVGHVGGDNGYGRVDQSVLSLRFRLE